MEDLDIPSVVENLIYRSLPSDYVIERALIQSADNGQSPVAVQWNKLVIFTGTFKHICCSYSQGDSQSQISGKKLICSAASTAPCID